LSNIIIWKIPFDFFISSAGDVCEESLRGRAERPESPVEVPAGE